MTREVVYVYRSNAGVVSGAFAIVFAILGIFTVGFIFVPLAIFLSVISFVSSIGLFRGFTYISGTGFLLSIIASFLSFWGVITSPSLLLLVGTGALLGINDGHQSQVSVVATDHAPSAVVAHKEPMTNICREIGTTNRAYTLPPAIRKKLTVMSGLQVYYRCISNVTYICVDYNGFNCDQPTVDRNPGKYISDFCRENRNEYPPGAITGHETVFLWRCANGTPVIESAQKLDEFGFRSGNWATLDSQNR